MTKPGNEANDGPALKTGPANEEENQKENEAKIVLQNSENRTLSQWSSNNIIVKM